MAANKVLRSRACLVASVGTAHSETAFRASYSIHVGGFRIGELLADISLGSESYIVRISLESRGVLGWFLDLRSETEAAGRIEDGRIIPRLYRADGRWNSQERSTRLTFGRDGLVEHLEIRPEPDHGPVPTEFQRAPDPASLLLDIIRSVHSPDDTAVHIFTSFGGIRAGRLKVSCPEYETVGLAEGIDLSSRTLRCDVEGQQTAGPPPRHIGGFGFENLATLWLVPRNHDAVPVQAEVNSSLGAMIVRLTRFESMSIDVDR